MQESQRRKETMRFFNMLNEPERTKAIANYDDKLDKRTPSTIIEAFDFCFAWENTPQFSYWANIYESIRVGKYNFKTEPMEQQSELDYQISVMQACRDGKEIESKAKGGDSSWWATQNKEDISWNWSYADYRLKPEPPQPNTEKFTFADADFLVGLKIKWQTDAWVGMIAHVNNERIWFGDGGSTPYSNTEWIIYQDRTTLEWKPFVKVIE